MRESLYGKAKAYRAAKVLAITGEGDTEVPLAQWDLNHMYRWTQAEFRATTRENVRQLLEEARYLEETAIELELASRILDRAGIPEEAGSVPERLRMMVLAHEQEVAALTADRDASRHKVKRG